MPGCRSPFPLAAIARRRAAFAARIRERATETGLEGLYHQIADEAVATTVEEVLPWV